MVLSVPVTGYVPGQDIPVTLEIDNASNICVTDVKCKLKQLITFIATSPYGSSREEEITVAEVIFDSVQPGGSSTAIQKITVPPLPPSDLDNCEIIDLAYYLKVVAEVSGCHSALKTSAPIVLGTIPLISYQPPFAPLPKGGSDICGDIGWTAPSVGPSYMQPNIPPPGEPHTAPSAPQLDGREESEEPRMPFPGPTAPLYPDIPPPTFAESIFGPMNIQDAEDSHYTHGNLSYVPRYPVYNFVGK